MNWFGTHGGEDIACGLKLIKMANTNPPPRQYTVQTAPRLSSNGALISNENDTNPVLLEAKLLESITSINQLISSNIALRTGITRRDGQ